MKKRYYSIYRTYRAAGVHYDAARLFHNLNKQVQDGEVFGH